MRGIGIANTLKTFHGFFTIAKTRVQIPHGIHHREILGIGLQNLFVLSDRVWQLALLDKLLRSTENLLFIEAKTKPHKSADSISVRPSSEDILTSTRVRGPS